MRRTAAFVFVVLAAGAGRCKAQASTRYPICPPPGDTLSLLQPGDSAYRYAPAVVAFLHQHGIETRCLTRSTSTGIAGLYNVAGLQTDQGTVTVLFMQPNRHLHVTETPTTHGYRYTFASMGSRDRPYVMNTDGRSYFMVHDSWLIEVFDPRLAAIIQRMLDEP